jgi:peptidoglycan/xylan/chitin deacetylase (PgdA/CDA1 family)
MTGTTRRHRGLVTAAALLLAASAGATAGLAPHRAAATTAAPAVATGTTAASAPAAATAPQTASGGRYVYLTFDDGPHPKYTTQIMAVLARYGARATFFQIGRNVRSYGYYTYLAHRRGHSVQNHTWSHPDLTKVSWSTFAREVVETDRFIYARTHVKPRCLRPPYGAANRLTYQRAAALGKTIKLWSIDTRDWQRPGWTAIAHRALSNVRSGSVILMHDGGGDRSQTVTATSYIVRTLKARGYAFYTLCR